MRLHVFTVYDDNHVTNVKIVIFQEFSLLFKMLFKPLVFTHKKVMGKTRIGGAE